MEIFRKRKNNCWSIKHVNFGKCCLIYTGKVLYDYNKSKVIAGQFSNWPAIACQYYLLPT